EALEQGTLNGCGGFLWLARALLERLERKEDGAGVRGIGKGCTGKPREVDGVRHARRLQGHFHDLAVDGIGAVKRSTARQLRDDDQVASVELRDEAARRLAELVEAVGNDRRLNDEHDHANAPEAGGEPAVSARHRLEASIEYPEEAVHGCHPPAGSGAMRVRLEEEGT